jgi:cytochrome b involved in lipid metabolism
MHPGGIDILSAYAGRDATKAFEKYHAENGKELLEGIQALKIGRMIKTYQPDAELAVGEVRIRDRVLLGDEASAAVKDLKGNPTDEFEAALKRMADGGADEPIVTLWNKRQDLVVGRVATPPEALSTITKRQMRVFNGEAQDSCFEHAAFMAVDDVVYDISTLLQFGHPTILGVLRQWAGRICTDKKVSEIMKTRYAFRAVARLSAHEAKDGVDWDPRRLRHDIEDAGLKRLAAKYVPWESEEQNRKRKFNEKTNEEEEEEEFTIPPQTVSKMPMPAPAVGGERPAKRRDGGVGDGSKWLDWKTEGLVEELQAKFASGQIFAEWQAREMERFETEARDMEGYWEKVAEERVGA